MGIFDWIKDLGGIAAAPFTGGTSLMATLAPIVAGAGLGIAKNQLVDAPNEARSRQVAATTTRYSPWTHLQPPPIKTAPGMFSSGLQGAALGAAAGNAMNSAPASGAVPSSGAPSLGVADSFAKDAGKMGQDVGNLASMSGGAGAAGLGQGMAGFQPPTFGRAAGMVANAAPQNPYMSQNPWLKMSN